MSIYDLSVITVISHTLYQTDFFTDVGRLEVGEVWRMLTYKGAVVIHFHDAGSASATVMSSRRLGFLTPGTQLVVIQATSVDHFKLTPFHWRRRPCWKKRSQHQIDERVECKQGGDP